MVPKQGFSCAIVPPGTSDLGGKPFVVSGPLEKMVADAKELAAERRKVGVSGEEGSFTETQSMASSELSVVDYTIKPGKITVWTVPIAAAG